jgi:CRP-like cAMP-binding protein
MDPGSLQRYSLFGGVTTEAIERLLPGMGRATFAAGEIILREGEKNDRVYFIEAGRVAVSRRGVRLAEMGVGDTFGEMELIDIMPTEATITAIEPVEAAVITNRLFHQLYKQDPCAFSMMIMNLARDISRRMRQMHERLLADEERLARER